MSSKPPRFRRVTMSMLTRNLEVCFGDEPPTGDDGRQAIRDLVMRLYECPPDSASKVVEHLEEEGFIRCGGQRRKRRRRGKRKRQRGPKRWEFQPDAAEHA